MATKKNKYTPWQKAMIRNKALNIKAAEATGIIDSKSRSARNENILMNDANLAKNKANREKVEANKDKVTKNKIKMTAAKNKLSYKTGGMVNPNAKVSALKTAGSKGVKSGVNPKAAASKVAKGRSGGTSTAPKTAVPKAKYGMFMHKK
jgi:hypothetical protein